MSVQDAVVTAGTLTVGTNLRVTDFLDDSATPGDRTVNTLRGRNSFAIGASTVVVTNSKCALNSQIVVTLEFVDATLTFIRTAIPAAGSFTVTGNANAAAATRFGWQIINP